MCYAVLYCSLFCVMSYQYCSSVGLHLTASVVNGKVGDGGSMAGHLPNLSVSAALPKQDVPL